MGESGGCNSITVCEHTLIGTDFLVLMCGTQASIFYSFFEMRNFYFSYLFYFSCVAKEKQNRQWPHNAKMKRVHATIVSVERQ